MFGLSLGKIVFTILVIVAVWRAWKWIGPLLAKLQASTAVQPEAPKAPERPQEAKSVELVACPHCGDFVPKGTFCGSREHCLIRRG
jgi:hypothetical protein